MTFKTYIDIINSKLDFTLHFGGENMEHLGTIGIFFAGFGVMMGSFGFFWWVSLYEKINFPKQKDSK